jgi:hypothetical protein
VAEKAGIKIRKIVPFPDSDRQVMVPWWFATVLWLVIRPIPVPLPPLVVKKP